METFLHYLSLAVALTTVFNNYRYLFYVAFPILKIATIVRTLVQNISQTDKSNFQPQE